MVILTIFGETRQLGKHGPLYKLESEGIYDPILDLKDLGNESMDRVVTVLDNACCFFETTPHFYPFVNVLCLTFIKLRPPKVIPLFYIFMAHPSDAGNIIFPSYPADQYYHYIPYNSLNLHVLL